MMSVVGAEGRRGHTHDVICQPQPGVQAPKPNSQTPGLSSATTPTSVPAPSAPLLAPRCPVIYVHALNALFLPTLPGRASLLGETIPDHPGWVCSPHPPLHRTVALYIDQFFYVCLPHLAVRGMSCALFLSQYTPPQPHRLSLDLTNGYVSHTHLLTCKESSMGPGAVLRKRVGQALGAALDNSVQ